MLAKTVKVLAASVLLLGTVNGQKAYSDEDGEVDPKLAMNRANPAGAATFDGLEQTRQPVRSTQAPLLDSFRGTTKKVVGDGIWKERGVATLWYDQEGQIVSVDVENTAEQSAGLEDMFKTMCEDNALYQLQLPDFELVTTQNACLYSQRGLNETLTFFTDDVGKKLISFSYNVSVAAEFVSAHIEAFSTKRENS